jgi:hypothetical protein
MFWTNGNDVSFVRIWEGLLAVLGFGPPPVKCRHVTSIESRTLPM